MKTITEWLSQLEEPYRTNALRLGSSELHVKKLSYALRSFSWSEDEEVWNDLYLKILDEENKEFHVTWMISPTESTGVNIKGTDMIDALERFYTAYPGVEPIYILSK